MDERFHLRIELARIIASFIGSAENLKTDVPGLTIHRRTAATAPCSMTYEPSLTVMAQGRKRVDLGQIRQSLLVVTAGADHIAPPEGTHPLLGLVGSEDVTSIDRPGGHIGLMAGSKAKKEIWPDITEWLEERSQAESQDGRNGDRADGGQRM